MVSLSLFGSSSQEQNATSKSNTDGSDKLPEPEKKNAKPLDIVFLQDTTGSQGPYIKAARQAIRDICEKISASAQFPKDLIRFGLIAFRDHPPQDDTYVTKKFGFTSDIAVMQKNLTNLVASGGGDGPEAQTAALAAALDLEWTEDAIKIVILITDAPPHGIGEAGDGFDKSPDQNDPLEIVRQMAEKGITLFVIACEPSLSQSYRFALDFYSALVAITSGRLFPLLMADKLGDYIIGTAVETIETEQLISEFEHVIVDDVYGKAKSIEEVMADVQQKLQSRGTKLQTMDIENIYTENEQGTSNRKAWFGATSLAEAKAQVKPVYAPRMKGEFAAPSVPIPTSGFPPTLSRSSAFPLARPYRPPPGAISEGPSSYLDSRRPISEPSKTAGFSEEDEEDEDEDDDIDEGGSELKEAKKTSVRMEKRAYRTARAREGSIEDAASSLPPLPPPPPSAFSSAPFPTYSSAPPPILAPAPTGYNPLMMATMSTAAASPAPAPLPQMQQQPKVTLERTEFSSAQARRLVMQSLTRNSKVTATGLVSKKGETAGQSVSIGEYIAE
ncbi:hypothetical protein BJ165DRAFT_1480153 [Panaeolus papilionaceus]|nr:hypothetical protein BJ165DRAFT_1480153 [Panaeolus papilionaceus]